MKILKYRLGFDLGYTSIGWAALKLDDNYQAQDIMDFGVRIFPSGRDAKSFAPTSTIRREKRGARRNRDRYLKRRHRLLKLMIELGLQPANKKARQTLAQKEPLAIRAQAVKEKVDLYDLGRALFHINQRRGFKSNRIADRKDDSDTNSGLLGGVDNLASLLSEKGLYLGEYLYARLRNGKHTRLKAGANQYDMWTSRKMYLDEFNQILETQKKYYPETLTDSNIEKLKSGIFFQRNLKPQEPGFCSLLDGKKRARLAYPESQLFRIYQEVNNLEIIAENTSTPRISRENRTDIVTHLTEDFSQLSKKNFLSWTKIQKIIGIKGVKFNLEALARGGLKANTTDILLEKALDSKWHKFSAAQKRNLIDTLLTSQSNKELKKELARISEIISINFTENETENLTALQGLKEGFGRVSLAAIDLILPHLKKGLIYDKACKAAGINHSDDRTGEVFDELPYYGEVLAKSVIGGTFNKKDIPEKRFGKINNPTVHMALNQFKVVINDLVKRFGGPPAEIHLEMARDTSMSTDELKEHLRQQTKNKKKNDEINAQLRKAGAQENYQNRMKYRLWEDLHKSPESRCCPLSGKPINMDNLFSHQVEVEHIIPFSISFDDGRNNKMLCYKSANQDKGNRTPFQAFGMSPKPYVWNEILARAKEMPYPKYRRFLPDAIEWFKGSDEGQYIARQLADSRYMSKAARKYAEAITPEVTTIKGKYTSDLRHVWGLERFTHNLIDGKPTKDRTNHHHHAIDALVVALADIRTMQKVALANRGKKKYSSKQWLKDIGIPYPKFNHQQIQEKLESMIISHKPDHKNPELARKTGTSIGQLHEDTSYGHITENIFATRKELSADNFSKQKNIEVIAASHIKAELQNIFDKYYDKEKRKLKDKKAYEQDLENYKTKANIKRLRIHLNKPDLISIQDKDGNPYRYVVGGNNFCAEIYCNQKGEKAGKWQSEVIQNYFANQKGFVPRWRQNNATAYKVMRLQINDMLAINKNGKRIICRVQKLSAKGIIVLRFHNDSETDQKTQISSAASSLQTMNARKLFVSPSGKIYDPGTARKPKNNNVNSGNK